ncbi:MAG: CPBP family intramembrane metalloprotease [Bacteroidales bacterium]|nr:CPBP family intramembrane metalloprotease [Bacteroidales bacterium]
MKQSFFYGYSNLAKFLSLIMIIFVCLLFTLLLGIVFAIPFFGTNILDLLSGLSIYENSESINLLKYFQVINQIGIFILPAIFYSYLNERNVISTLKLNIRPKILTLIFASILIFISIPFVDWMISVNQAMKFPEFLNNLENWFRESENQAIALTELFLEVNTIWGLLFNIFMIGIMAAISEEFLFRGVLLKLFADWTKNIHLAVIFSATLFSAFHLQFYGFFPRFMLGVLLAYLYVWTKSLWVPIFIHFLNNAIAIIISFLFNKGVISFGIESVGIYNTYVFWGSILLIITFITLIFLNEKGKLLKI